MGFKFAAFTEGSSPNRMPMAMENTTAKKMNGTLMATGASVSRETSWARPMPAPTPMSRPGW